MEDELTDMEVTMLMEPIQVDDTEQDDMALGLAILTSESYVTPTKTVRSSTFLLTLQSRWGTIHTSKPSN